MKLVKKILIALLSLVCIITSCVLVSNLNGKKQGEVLASQEGKFFYLSDMPHSGQLYQDWYSTYAINQGFPNDKVEQRPLQLRVNDSIVTYDKGFCFQSNARYWWDFTNVNATRFTAKVGILQRADWLQVAPSGATAQLVIKTVENGVDVDLYRGDILSFTDNAVDVDITIPANTTNLHLQIKDGGDGIGCDNLVVAEPKVYADFTYLSDMSASNTNMGYGNLLYDNVLEGEISLLNNISETVGEVVYTHNTHVNFEKNLFLHATSTADFDVSKLGATRFTAFVGITSTKGYFDGADGAIFRVYAKNSSGTVLGSKEYTYGWGATMGSIDFAIPSGTTTLTLEANKNANDFCDHTMFCMPMIFGTNLTASKAVSLTATNDSLTVGDTETVKLYSTTYDNEVSEINNFTLAVGDGGTVTNSTNIIKIINGNQIEAVGVGSASVIATYEQNGYTNSTWMGVVVGSPESTTNAQLRVVSPDENTKLTITREN